jgi:DNA-binding transcriptional LysR family regulator
MSLSKASETSNPLPIRRREVRIAAPIALATGFVAAAIDRFARRHPRVVCHPMVDRTDRTYPALEGRDVDLVISFIIAPIAEDHMEAELLYADSQFVVAATKNPWSRRRRLRLDDLTKEPWTLPPPDSVLGAAHADIFRAAGRDLPAATVRARAVSRLWVLSPRGAFLPSLPNPYSSSPTGTWRSRLCP